MTDLTRRQIVDRTSNMTWIRSLGVDMTESGAMVSVKVLHRQIDFFPTSNTYFLHSKNEYGYGIQELVEKIKEYQK